MAGETSPNGTADMKPAEILVIDGNEEHQMLSALALGRKGFRVTAANSGKEGLRAALSRPFDAIVLDHKVKDRPAFEVLENLRSRLPGTPTIFVVSPGSEDLAVKALAAGASGYLVKTARYNEVLPSEVESQILKARTRVQLEEQQKALVEGTSQRERVEDALRVSEERLHLLVEQAPFILWTTDPELKLTSAAGSGLASFNASPGQILGRPMTDLFAGVDPANAFFEAHRRALAGEASRFEQGWQRRTYDIHMGPLRDRGGAVLGVFGVALDVTERVRAARIQSSLYRIAQAAQEAPSLRDLFRSIHLIVGELMPAKNFYIAIHPPETDVLEFPYFVDQAEDPPGPQPMGRGLTEYVLRTGRPVLASPSAFEDLVASGEVVQIGPASIDWLGVPLATKERTIGVIVVQSYEEGIRYTEEDLDILRFVSSQIAQAIDRRETEDALREQERFLDTLISNLPGLAYRCKNDEDWTNEYVSEGVEELLGYTREEMGRGVKWGDLIHPEDRQQVWDDVQAALRSKQSFRLTYRLRTRAGRVKWVWEQGRGVYSPTGELVALEGFITDVSPWRVPPDSGKRVEAQ